MVFKVRDYDEYYEADLLDLSYQSNFHNKKEFDYVRVPNNWLFRYALNKGYITKIAVLKNHVVGSVGLSIGTGIIGRERIKIGFLTDICVLPEYTKNKEEILENLFNEVENEAMDRRVEIIMGWEYLRIVNKEENLFKRLGFKWIEGTNWISSSVPLSGTYPFKWKAKIPFIWSFLFRIMNLYHTFKEEFISPLPKDMTIRGMDKDDIPKLCDMLKDLGVKTSTFRPVYDCHELENLLSSGILHGLIAERDFKIIGFLTYIVSAWSGWMFGKPYYDKEFQIFYGLSPDDFFVLPEYEKTSLPIQMIIKLMKVENPEKGSFRSRGYNFIADVFDNRISWRKNSLSNLGFTEPKFDYGVILAKSLRDDIKLDTKKIWHLPARYIVAPVPSSSYFQK